MPGHPLEDPAVVRAIERVASTHRGSRWTATGFTDLNDRASHPCGILSGRPFSVFAKVDRSPEAVEQFTVELAGHDLIRRSGGVATPEPVGDGPLRLDAGAVLLLEAVTEVPAEARTADQWRDIGRAFVVLHRARADRFGLSDFDGYFGPLRQDNRPVRSDRWADFYAERRLWPRLREAVERGRLDADVAAGVERLIGRLPELSGPQPLPSLVHGDAQQNNVLTTAAGPVLFDAAPYFGHPEIDLALVDYFEPVPDALFDGHREAGDIDPEFAQRRELWRLYGYLAVVTVDGDSAFTRPYRRRIENAIAFYR